MNDQGLMPRGISLTRLALGSLRYRPCDCRAGTAYAILPHRPDRVVVGPNRLFGIAT